ncbi:MAG: tRNA pseudouridine(38-40) synthase TruA [Bacteroidales bacterium]|nr:tRNA pseudouridine(38-40) synthase TruA [Bacteroidales bacterium]
MARYFVELAYNGTRYHGWQSQPNALSVQQEIDKALSMLLRENIGTTGAGRTDTGVHARFFVAHFDSERLATENYDHLVYQLNAILPKDIVVTGLYRVKADAHARYSALSRTYVYTISSAKDPFNSEFAWHYTVPLKIDIMNKAAGELLRHSDFTSFSKLHSNARTNICSISEAYWSESGNQLLFTITADRFLRNMVRSIVGTLVDIGRGRLYPAELTTIIEARDRNRAGFSAPAHGLALVNIKYNGDIRE